MRIFIEFLDSFTGTSREESKRNLPPECAVGEFVDTCDSCWDECFAAGIYAFSFLNFKKVYEVPGTAVASGYLFWRTITLPFEKIADCGRCLIESANKNSVALLACSDEILICIYKVD